MIVDDNARMRGVLRSMLRKKGNNIVECSNGAEALRRFAEFKPDVVLMDIEMPEMDGFEATRRVRVLDPAARVVIVTNHDTPLHRREAERAGASGFVSKENLTSLATFLASLEHMKKQKRRSWEKQ